MGEKGRWCAGQDENRMAKAQKNCVVASLVTPDAVSLIVRLLFFAYLRFFFFEAHIARQNHKHQRVRFYLVKDNIAFLLFSTHIERQRQ